MKSRTPLSPFLLLSLLCFSTLWGQGKKQKPINYALNSKNWATLTDNVSFDDYKGVSAASSTNDKPFQIMLKDVEFANGIIEFDVELKGMGFPGITFRIDKDSLNGEIFYLRHFGDPDPMLRTTMQYAAIVDKVNLWDLTDEYQAASSLLENQWNHIKMVINGKQMRVYVNNMKKPSLYIPAMEGITSSGAISLSGNVVFANMQITPDATEGIPADEGYDPTASDSRYLRNWQVTEPIDFPFGEDLLKGIPYSPGVAIRDDLWDSTATWQDVKASRRGLVNLTYNFGQTESGSRRLTWLKTTINAKTAISKRLDFGFSDEVWLFINGQPLYIDKNYYGSPGMKEPKGRCTLENSSIDIPLQEGENEILIGLTNYFYGWGVIARFSNNEGIVHL
ncbi:hypothetical protein D1013_02505 [Euzebyella marina]|uniref:DUF1080 domain-containing protein n=1 Tax=Euzebyella marina TaxID=1761453 RepID=A0A3G2L2A5_9FLAO|nr:hypothetical protein [Euzebyella marina]AYN66336.1 hypothetical protein D1013_02505 [Euzebyella marina]